MAKKEAPSEKEEPAKKNEPVSMMGTKSSSCSSAHRERSSSQKSPTKFGKSNPVRDSFLIVGFLTFLYWCSMDSDPSIKKGDQDDATQRLNIVDALSALAKAAASNRRTEECAMFLDTGSIPETGLSLFAGRSYEAGELILETPMLLPLGRDQKGEPIFVSQYGILLKHHPELSNVQGLLWSSTESAGLDAFVLRASRAIEAGEELFVSYDGDLHKTPLFQHIASADDYKVAGEIVADSFNTMSYLERTTRGQKLDTTSFYSLLKRSVGKFNRRVEALIPGNSKHARACNRDAPQFALLRNRTLAMLQTYGTCIDDVKRQGEGVLVLANRRATEGQVVARVPLHITDTMATSDTDEQKCSLASRFCFGDEHTRFQFCPLMNAGFAGQAEEANAANIEYRWKDEAMRELTAHEISNSPAGSLVWDVVALRNIKVGEELWIKERSAVLDDSHSKHRKNA